MADVGYFKSRDSRLSYSYVIPQKETRESGIIFVHAADGNRLGPHRMFVELGNKFNSLGYPTLRFDLSGCGDSTGAVSRSDITAEVSDVVAAIDFFMAEAHLENIILFGISRGARVCLSAMAEHKLPLGTIILLSTPASTEKAAMKSFSVRLKEYIYKFRDPKSLWKLLSGKANIVQIGKTLTTALKLDRRYTPIEKKNFASRCPVLFIYGENDPTAAESSRYYASKCRESNLLCDCHTIANANHSFFHYKWKEQIFDISRSWLAKILS